MPRSLRGQARLVVVRVVDQALTSDTGLDMCLAGFDVVFEAPDEKGLYSTVRDPKKERHTT